MKSFLLKVKCADAPESNCYATTTCSAWLELFVKIWWLAPSDVLGRQLNDAQLVGS